MSLDGISSDFFHLPQTLHLIKSGLPEVNMRPTASKESSCGGPDVPKLPAHEIRMLT